MQNLMQAVGQLIVDLFTIWNNYPTFSLLFSFIIVFCVVKLVQGLTRML